jgi:hypothetical protein
MPLTDELRTTIIAELRLSDLPQQGQDQIVEAVAQNIFDALMVTILERLPDDAAREKLTQMAEAGDLTALKAYARSQIEDFDNLMAGVVRDEIEAHKP